MKNELPKDFNLLPADAIVQKLPGTAFTQAVFNAEAVPDGTFIFSIDKVKSMLLEAMDNKPFLAKPITASLMHSIDEGAYCVMVAYRSENEARAAMELLDVEPEPKNWNKIVSAADVITHTYSTRQGEFMGKKVLGVRLIHKPTNTVISCDEKATTNMNKDAAWRLLLANLAEKGWTQPK